MAFEKKLIDSRRQLQRQTVGMYRVKDAHIGEYDVVLQLLSKNVDAWQRRLNGDRRSGCITQVTRRQWP